MPLDYPAVSEIVTSLDNDFEELRIRAERRYELYRMRHEPYVPEEVAREGKLRITSPLVMYAAETIRADLMMNPTEFSVFPLARERDGTITKKMISRSENLERSLAILWGRMNEGRRLDREVIWHQLVSPYAVLMLEFQPYEPPEQSEDMDDATYMAMTEYYHASWLPWHISTPDPMTCSWVEKDGKPVIMARYFKILVKDIERLYEHNARSTAPDMKLHYNGERTKFEWVSDDFNKNTHDSRQWAFEEVQVMWLDDGKEIYMCVQNPGSRGEDGLVLECVPNPIGRCTGFIVPGNLTPDRKPEDRYEPFLLPLMQCVSDINNIRSLRATAARNLAGPHTYVAIDPEIQKIYMARGEKLPTEVRWKKNTTHYLLGEVKEIPSEVSLDWDKLEERMQEDLIRFLPSPFVNIVDPSVIREATATSILHAAEAGLRMYGPLMSAYDSTVRDILEAVTISVRTFYDEQVVSLHSLGDEHAHGRPLKEGSHYTLDKDTVDFPYKITVKTRGMSRAQAQAQYEAVLAQWILPDGSKGPATFDDLLEAAQYNDPVAQKKKLAAEAMLYAVDPWLKEMAIAAAHQEILTDSGLDLPLMPVPGGEQTPAAMPNQAQRMESPLMTGIEGGSSPMGGT